MKPRSLRWPRPGDAVGRFFPGAVATAAAAVSACAPPPPPRSYDFFMEDSIARDGVIAHCDRRPEEAQRDIECANARRAAMAVLLREERERRALFERESERKLEALRRRIDAEQQALRDAEQAAAADDAADEPPWDEDAGSTSAGSLVDPAAAAADATGVAADSAEAAAVDPAGRDVDAGAGVAADAAAEAFRAGAAAAGTTAAGASGVEAAPAPPEAPARAPDDTAFPR